MTMSGRAQITHEVEETPTGTKVVSRIQLEDGQKMEISRISAGFVSFDPDLFAEYRDLLRCMMQNMLHDFGVRSEHLRTTREDKPDAD